VLAPVAVLARDLDLSTFVVDLCLSPSPPPPPPRFASKEWNGMVWNGMIWNGMEEWNGIIDLGIHVINRALLTCTYVVYLSPLYKYNLDLHVKCVYADL
jgi:hypothetical protein